MTFRAYSSMCEIVNAWPHRRDAVNRAAAQKSRTGSHPEARATGRERSGTTPRGIHDNSGRTVFVTYHFALREGIALGVSSED